MIFSDQKLEVEKSSLRENFPTIINSNSRIAGDILLQTDIGVDGSICGLAESDNNIFVGTKLTLPFFLESSIPEKLIFIPAHACQVFYLLVIFWCQLMRLRSLLINNEPKCYQTGLRPIRKHFMNFR